MLANNRISAVLVSTDLERSQRFYETKVGLTLSPETIKNHLLFDCGDGTTLLVYGRGLGNKADNTTSGDSPARAITAASRSTSLTMRTVSNRSPGLTYPD
jgi:hypothetical protein